jgi:TetR/AcrR family transcriptional repressor of nem operon
MGRRKGYDRDQLLSMAMEVFRDKGFAGASAETLVASLGVNRYSIYAEFGSKQALFEEALKRYDQENVANNFGPLEAPDAGLEEVHELLKFFSSASKSPAWGRGCLLCNTAVEFGPDDPTGEGFIQKYFQRLSSAFRNALENAVDQGQLDKSVDPDVEASFLTSSVLGLFVMLRAKAPELTIKSAAQAAIDHLNALRIND